MANHQVDSLPVPPVEHGQERSPVGSFPRGDEFRVVKQVLADLPTTIDELVRRYADVVTDSGRQVAARESLLAADAGKLETEHDLVRLVEILYFAGFQRHLAKHHLLFPAYNILDEYFVNANGPWGPATPWRPTVPGRKWIVLGKAIGFPIGIPASVLTGNAQWVHYFARNGFNVLTYKTVRSRAQVPSIPPNWTFLPGVKKPLPISDDMHRVSADRTDWVDAGRQDVSTANSFGVPSMAPHVWEGDIEEALNVIHDDQLLIVSVMGDDYDGTGDPLVLAADYAAVAKRAERVGVGVVELNLSCPNSLDPDHDAVRPPLCLDIDVTRAVVAKVRDTLDPDTRIVAKLAYLEDDALADVLEAIGPLIDGVAGINTLQCRVVDKSGVETFPGRLHAGVSGIAIRNHAQTFVRRLARLRLEMDLRFDILGMGGVTDSTSFAALYEAGALAVQTATGAFANPFLAWECVDRLGEELPSSPPMGDPQLEQELQDAILEVAVEAGPIDQFSIAAAIPVPPSQTFDVLRELVESGALIAEQGEAGTIYRASAAK